PCHPPASHPPSPPPLHDALPISRSRPAPRVILAVEVQLRLRLHHQSLRDPKIVRAFQSSSHVAAVAEVERGRKLEVVGCEPLDTDRKSTRLNSSHQIISYAVFCF